MKLPTDSELEKEMYRLELSPLQMEDWQACMDFVRRFATSAEREETKPKLTLKNPKINPKTLMGYSILITEKAETRARGTTYRYNAKAYTIHKRKTLLGRTGKEFSIFDRFEVKQDTQMKETEELGLYTMQYESFYDLEKAMANLGITDFHRYEPQPMPSPA